MGQESAWSSAWSPSADAWSALASAVLAVLPIWVFGAVVGLLLPRPKWMSRGPVSGKSATLLLSTPLVGSWLRKAALVVHALVILREVWHYLMRPGTFRALLRATVQWCGGRGWSFQWPALPVSAAAALAGSCEGEQSCRSADNWYVGEKDLAFFKYHAVEGGPLARASAWEVMLDKDIPGFVRYTAWRRTLPDGKTEYKSVTVCPNATAQEFMDMYLDDAFRPNWDGMVVHHEVLEHGDFGNRQQVVRWIRRFPFSFLSDREYTIARRMYAEPDGSLYAITKSLPDHPRASRDSRVVKMDVFWSMWRSRTVADPWGGEAPACETTLLHHEQFKIPENLARFAVKHGMWGFVRKLASTVPQFVEERQRRAGRYEADPGAYGAGNSPNPPLRRDASCSSLSSASSVCGSEASDADVRCGGYTPRSGSGRVRGVAAVVIAGGLALALRSAGVAGGSGVAGSSRERKEALRQRSRRQQRQRSLRGSASCSSIAEEL